MDTLVRDAQEDVYLKSYAAGYSRRISWLYAAASGGVDFTSATLSIANKFDYFAGNLGLSDATSKSWAVLSTMPINPCFIIPKACRNLTIPILSL